jgi:hypothetical protein
MASYEETKARMMRQYLTLYPSETHVLHYLFCVIGIGYEWQGGELVCLHERTDAEVFADRARRHREMMKESAEQYDNERARAALIAINRDIKRHGLAYAGQRVDSARDALPPVKELYPLCKYAAIVTIPDDVKADWLDAAERALTWALSDDVKRDIGDAGWLAKARRRIKQIQRARRDAARPSS